jgi:ATP-binding cassette, subfamily B, bacterial IrtA/YbtP
MAATPVTRLLFPVRGRIRLACVLQAGGAAAGIVPLIAVAEFGRRVLTDGVADPSELQVFLVIAAGALALRFALELTAGGLLHLADLSFQQDLRRRIVDHLARLPLGWFSETNAGAVKKALNDDVAALHHLLAHTYTSLVSATVTPLVALVYLYWVDWRLTLLALLPVGVGLGLYALQYRGFGSKLAEYDAALGKVNAAAVAYVEGIAVIKTFGQAGAAFDRFRDATADFARSFRAWVGEIAHLSAASEVVLSPPLALVIILTGGLGAVSLGWVAPADLLPVLVVGVGIAAPLLAMGYAQNTQRLATEAAGRIVALLDTPPLPESSASPAPADMTIRLEGVGFSYDGLTSALSGIDLTMAPGTVTALVGPSGSGKSTLARLLPRFWDPSEGRITLGGVPLPDLPAASLYACIGFVFQEVQLLRVSIRDNIALGLSDAPQAQVEDAARAAAIHDRILALPRGYDSVVGEDARLSGGEAQRIAIARAILRDPPVLVLDEATSFADPESEAEIQAALAQLVKGRTLLVIAHRLATIAGADRICVMASGRIVEAGTHDALLREGGRYAALWAAETRSESLEAAE